MRASVAAAGFDPEAVENETLSTQDFAGGGDAAAKAWRDVWGCG